MAPYKMNYRQVLRTNINRFKDDTLDDWVIRGLHIKVHPLSWARHEKVV